LKPFAVLAVVASLLAASAAPAGDGEPRRFEVEENPIASLGTSVRRLRLGMTVKEVCVALRRHTNYVDGLEKYIGQDLGGLSYGVGGRRGLHLQLWFDDKGKGLGLTKAELLLNERQLAIVGE
jgi:hypothetical protein